MIDVYTKNSIIAKARTYLSISKQRSYETPFSSKSLLIEKPLLDYYRECQPHVITGLILPYSLLYSVSSILIRDVP